MLGGNLQKRQVVPLVNAKQFGFERAAIVQLAGDVPCQIMRLRENPTIGAYTRSKAGVLAIALHANDVGNMRPHDLAENLHEFRIGAEIISRATLGTRRQGRDAYEYHAKEK